MKNKGEKKTKTGNILLIISSLPILILFLFLLLVIIMGLIEGGRAESSEFIVFTVCASVFLIISIFLLICIHQAKYHKWCNNVFLILGILFVLCSCFFIGLGIYFIIPSSHMFDINNPDTYVTLIPFGIGILVIPFGVCSIIGAKRGKKWIPVFVEERKQREELEKQRKEEALQKRKEIINNQGNGANETENKNSDKGGFDGRLIQEIGWYLLGSLVTIITLGICYPLAYCWMLKWNYKHTLYDGKRLSFDGKATQLIGKWICWLLLSIVTLGIFSLFIPKKLMNWKVKHLHLEGEHPELGGTFKANALAYVFVCIGCFLLSILTLSIFRPIFITWENRYIQNRLVIDGRRMEFDGKGTHLLGKYILWTLLKIITLGIYGLFVHIKLKKWVAKYTHIKQGYELIEKI